MYVWCALSTYIIQEEYTMEKHTENDSKLITALKRLFLIIVFAVCGYFVVGQVMLSYEQDIGSGQYQILSEVNVMPKEMN